MSDAKFETLLTLYRAADFGEGRAATLTVSNESINEALTTCLSDAREYAVGLDADSDEFAIGSTVNVVFEDPRTGLGALARSLSEILQPTRYRLKEPNDYFLIDSKFAKNDGEIPSDVQKYRQVLRLIKLLKQAAAFLDSDEGALVFVHGGKFELPIEYGVKDLRALDDATIAKLLSFVGDDAHVEKKLGILEGAVKALLESWPKEQRFVHLLSNLSQLAEKTRDGYQLFIADFSYDKVRDATEAAKVEYAGKIHKAFSDIQTQILGIPVATIVVASQMKDAKVIGYEFWVNTAVLVGCWVFAILVAFVLWNQTHTLAVLDAEIERQKELIKKQYKDIASQFVGVFKFLRRRLCLQRWALRAVGFVLFVGLILAHVIYFKLTVPAQAWLPMWTRSDTLSAVKTPAGSAVPPSALGAVSGKSDTHARAAQKQNASAATGASGVK
ncbi:MULTISPECIES: hypothetical protein [Paraburkholderia]|uniref:hypothetical protein n=1 Tax=Paraburkholderia TaxID=1822464 RepID=UPI002250C109|nr:MULTISPECIES: hypothetical protein [Paraburkholderia]MCX4163578.1 hypothetical protein [Paraburkholderia megapolitana]MDN7159073.1 hypothetical protein [Paraburkholderia sp. CHISQ3]MDQ6496120.1 hypothetical protein [Paraburkholderia megapolitana]